MAALYATEVKSGFYARRYRYHGVHPPCKRRVKRSKFVIKHIFITQNYQKKKTSKDMSNNRSHTLHTGLEKGQLVMAIQEVIIFIQMRKTTTKNND